MYAVVGCNRCGALWLLSDPGETATCPQCSKRHQTRKLKRFYESDDREAARQARAAMLAERRDESGTFGDLESVAEMERRLDEAGVGDREFLTASGLDADAVEAAGDVSRERSRSRTELVRDAVAEQDRPTESEIVAYAEARGVPAEAARNLLERLAQAGEVSEHRGRYRLL
jgi:predicted  nucleic acid-binding Zn-ribbon protein